MATLPPLASVARLSFLHTCHTEPLVSTLHWQFTGPMTYDDLKALVQLAGPLWQSVVMPNQSRDSTYDGCNGNQAVPGSGFTYNEPPSAPTIGGYGIDCNEPNRSTCVSLRTNKGGPSYRGRLFYPATPDTVVTDGLLDLGYRLNCAARIEQFIADLDTAAAAWTPVVVSYYSENAVRVVPVTTRITSVASINKRASYLASRNNGK